jgi:hypothetical protein
MPSRAKKVSRDVAKLPSVPKELVAHFLIGPMTGEAIETAGVAFKKALIEGALSAEPGHHLGYAFGADRPEDATNHRRLCRAATKRSCRFTSAIPGGCLHAGRSTALPGSNAHCSLPLASGRLTRRPGAAGRG